MMSYSPTLAADLAAITSRGIPYTVALARLDTLRGAELHADPRPYDPDRDPQPLDTFAWPGGYPILYVTEDGGTFCGAHAWAVIVREDVPMARDILWEGPAEWCEEGSHPIPSAYGDPDDPQDEPDA